MHRIGHCNAWADCDLNVPFQLLMAIPNCNRKLWHGALCLGSKRGQLLATPTHKQLEPNVMQADRKGSWSASGTIYHIPYTVYNSAARGKPSLTADSQNMTTQARGKPSLQRKPLKTKIIIKNNNKKHTHKKRLKVKWYLSGSKRFLEKASNS